MTASTDEHGVVAGPAALRLDGVAAARLHGGHLQLLAGLPAAELAGLAPTQARGEAVTVIQPLDAMTPESTSAEPSISVMTAQTSSGAALVVR